MLPLSFQAVLTPCSTCRLPKDSSRYIDLVSRCGLGTCPSAPSNAVGAPHLFCILITIYPPSDSERSTGLYVGIKANHRFQVVRLVFRPNRCMTRCRGPSIQVPPKGAWLVAPHLPSLCPGQPHPIQQRRGIRSKPPLRFRIFIQTSRAPLLLPRRPCGSRHRCDPSHLLLPGEPTTKKDHHIGAFSDTCASPVPPACPTGEAPQRTYIVCPADRPQPGGDGNIGCTQPRRPPTPHSPRDNRPSRPLRRSSFPPHSPSRRRAKSRRRLLAAMSQILTSRQAEELHVPPTVLRHRLSR